MTAADLLGQILFALSCLDPEACITQSEIPAPRFVGAAVPLKDRSGLLVSDMGTARGDWEAPDVMIMAFNESWPIARDIMVQTAARSADVWIVLEDGHSRAAAKAWRRRLPEESRARVRILDVRVDSPWVRDYGPLQLRNPDGGTQWLDATYSGSRPLDDVVPVRLGNLMDAWVSPLEFGLDGGALVSNGRGLCATTVEYLETESVEATDDAFLRPLAAKLGCRGLALLPALEDEPTAHVDPFVQFLGPDLAAVAMFDPETHPEDYDRTELAAAALVRAASRLGQTLRLVRVPTWAKGESYYTYINGLRLGDSYLVPTFDAVPSDIEEAAHAALGWAMPDVELVLVPGDRLVDHDGVVHCATLGIDIPFTPNRPDPELDDALALTLDEDTL